MGFQQEFGFGSRAKAQGRHPRARLDRGLVGAGAAGFSDALTFGAGDHISSAMRAVGGAKDFSDWLLRYRTEQALEKARDAYDRSHHPKARIAGQIAGTGAQLAALGPLDGAFAGATGIARLAGVGRGVRLAETTAIKAHELGAIGAGGAATGAGGQVVSDLRSGRPGTAGDYAGAAIGGAVDALGSRYLGPGKSGAIGGATTSVLQDALNGRAISPEDAQRSAAEAGGIGGLVGLGASARTARLTSNAKGSLGEMLSDLRTAVGGDYSLPGRRRVLPSGRSTITDRESLAGVTVESKFGPWARLSRAQREAMRVLPKYRVDHFRTSDVGALFGVPASLLGSGGLRTNGQDQRTPAGWRQVR